MTDALAIAVGGLEYYMLGDRLDGKHPPHPSSLNIRWCIARHPCDDRPYLADLSVFARP